jgi:hypothetical protein
LLSDPPSSTGDTGDLSAASSAVPHTNNKKPTTTTTKSAAPSSHGSRPRTTAERRADFAIRPGYSSGASSYDGSVGDDLSGADDELNDIVMQKSRHSDILALSDLRQEMVAEGDLTKTVVRIEVSRENGRVDPRGGEIVLLLFIVRVSNETSFV